MTPSRRLSGPECETPLWQQELDEDAEREFVDTHGSVNEVAVGTVLEYDDWQWAVVTELTTDRDEPMFGFVLLDQVEEDSVIPQLESAVGCRQHYAAVETFRDTHHEFWTPVEYVMTHSVWTVLGPVHPDYRGDS